MSDGSKIRMTVADDEAAIEVGFKGGVDQEWYVATFKTLALDELLHNLGVARTAMKPAVSPEWIIGQPVKCFRNPAWFIEIEQLAGDAVLHLRDDRYGWLHYVIDKEEAAKLAVFFAAVAATPTPETAGSA